MQVEQLLQKLAEHSWDQMILSFQLIISQLLDDFLDLFYVHQMTLNNRITDFKTTISNSSK